MDETSSTVHTHLVYDHICSLLRIHFLYNTVAEPKNFLLASFFRVTVSLFIAISFRKPFQHFIKLFSDLLDSARSTIILYHLKIITTSLLFDVQSNNWPDSKPLFEVCKCFSFIFCYSHTYVTDIIVFNAPLKTRLGPLHRISRFE